MSHTNSLQPFQPVMYPSALAPLMKSSSNPDLVDPIAFDLKGMREKLSRTRNFWANGMKSAACNLIKVPPPDAIQMSYEQFANADSSQPSSSINIHQQQPFILKPKISSATPPQSLHPQFFLTPPSSSSQMFFQNFPTPTTFPPVQPQQPESLTLNDSLDQDSIADSEVTVVAADQMKLEDNTENVQIAEQNQLESSSLHGQSTPVIDVTIENVEDDESSN